MTSTYVYSITLTKLECGNCHIPFAIPSNLHTARFNDGGSFYCPNGHYIHYSETENARLWRELERERRRLANTQDDLHVEKLSHRATKGQLTKTRNRIHAGVCPHCQRTFQNVARHMKSQHPEP